MGIFNPDHRPGHRPPYTRSPDHPANAAGPALAAFVCALLVMTTLGCTGGGEPAWRRVGGGGGGGDVSNVAAWQPRPTAIRVYPSTRFVRERGKPLLELTVELFDDMGDSIKASGRYGVELYASRDPNSPRPGEFLRGWDADVLSMEQHELHYDSITRGYLFRLELEEQGGGSEGGSGAGGDAGGAVRVPRAAVVRVEFRPATDRGAGGEGEGEGEALRTQALIRTGE